MSDDQIDPKTVMTFEQFQSYIAARPPPAVKTTDVPSTAGGAAAIAPPVAAAAATAAYAGQAVRPIAQAPAPSTAVSDAPERVTSLSMDQISDHLIRKGAPHPMNPTHPANAPYLEELHRRLDAEMARIRVMPARRF